VKAMNPISADSQVAANHSIATEPADPRGSKADAAKASRTRLLHGRIRNAENPRSISYPTFPESNPYGYTAAFDHRMNR